MKKSLIENNVSTGTSTEPCQTERLKPKMGIIPNEDFNIPGYQYSLKLAEHGFDIFTDKVNSHKKKPKSIQPFLISILPTGFQESFSKVFSKAFPHYAGNEKGAIAFKGRMRSDNVFYKQLEKLTSADLLPDILITHDCNNLYHRNFQRTILNDQNFENLHLPMHQYFCGTKFSHPSDVLGMLASDALVMVVNKAKLNDIRIPREWYELLNPGLKNRITLCGDLDYFSNTFYFHFIKNFGYEAIQHLTQNTNARMHPEEMLQAIHTQDPTNTSLYVMPYSYAKNIQDKMSYQIIWPEDGAILLPIQLLVKKGTRERHEDIIQFLTGETLGKEFAKQGFLPTNPNIAYCQQGELNWIGWEFLENNDLSKMKTKIRKLI